MKIRTEFEEYKIEIVDGKEMAAFYCVPLTTKEEEKLIKSFTKKVLVKGQLTDDTNWTGLRNARFDRIVKRWEGVEDEHGEHLECNKLNKELFIQFNSAMAAKIIEEIDKIAEDKNAVKTELEKN